MIRERDREFFRPVWRRVAVVVLLVAWTAWEWSNGDSLWGTIVGGTTVYFIWAYVIMFPADGGETSERPSKE